MTLLSDEQLQAIKTNAELDGYMYWTNCQKVFAHIEAMQSIVDAAATFKAISQRLDELTSQDVSAHHRYNVQQAKIAAHKKLWEALAAVKERSECATDLR